MGGLQRSGTSYRRSGSSCLVWDEKLFSGELKRVGRPRDEEEHQETRSSSEPIRNRASPLIRVERDRNISTHHRRMKEISPNIEPPSPRVSDGCFCCRTSGKPVRTR